MSRFAESVPKLVELTGRRLFALMAEDNVPRPMLVGITHELFAVEPDEQKRRLIKRFVGRLAHSNSYRRAVLLEGSMRHDLEGVPVMPVSADHKAFVKVKLGEATKAQAVVREKRTPQIAPSGRPVLTLNRRA